MRRAAGFACVTAVALAASAGPAAAAKVGVAAGVAPSAWGAPPVGAQRSLQVGANLEAGERVRTNSTGSLQILFEDRSSISLGPDAELTLDEYVYRPERGEGRIGLSLGKGLLRFVGGAISKDSPAGVRTPTATIGIRGGVAIVEAGETTSATFLFGSAMTVTAGGETVEVARPGFRIAIGPDGRPMAPQPVTAEMLGDMLRRMEPGPAPAGAQPGLSVADEDVAQTQLAMLNEFGLLGGVETAAGGDGSPPTLPDGDGAELDEASRQEPGRLTTAPEEEEPAVEPPGPSRPSGPLSGRAKFATDPVTGAPDSDPARNKPLAGASFGDGRFEADAGDGLLILVEEAGVFGSTAQPFGGAGLTGQGIAFDPDFVVFELAQAGGGRAIAFAGAPTAPSSLPETGVTRYELRADFLRGQTLPFIQNIADPASGAAPRPSHVYIAWDDSAAGAQRGFAGGAIAIFGAGADQQRAASYLFGDVSDDAEGRPHVRAHLFGLRRAGTDATGVSYRGGVASADAADGPDFLGASGNFVLEAALVDVADAVLGRGVTVSGDATIFPNHVAASPAAQTGARSTRTLSGFAAGLERTSGVGGPAAVQMLTTAGQLGVTISTQAELNTLGAAFKLQNAGVGDPLQIQFGGAAPSGLSAFIDDATFVAASAAETTGEVFALITSSELQHRNFLPAGAAFCACEFVSWGFWSGERSDATGTVRQVELAAWVAGQPFAASLLGLPTQTAVYSGHLIGEVANGPATYQAAGGLQVSVRFTPGGYRLENASISGFDGMNFASEAGSIMPNFTGSAYNTNGMTLKSDVGAVTAELRGAFFGSAPDGQPPLETAGDFAMTGPDYQAAGVYAARR